TRLLSRSFEMQLRDLFPFLVEPVNELAELRQFPGADSPVLNQMPHQRQGLTPKQSLDQVINGLTDDFAGLYFGGIDAGSPYQPADDVALGFQPAEIGLHRR